MTRGTTLKSRTTRSSAGAACHRAGGTRHSRQGLLQQLLPMESSISDRSRESSDLDCVGTPSMESGHRTTYPDVTPFVNANEARQSDTPEARLLHPDESGFAETNSM